jgi:hypothetical protein
MSFPRLLAIVVDLPLYGLGHKYPRAVTYPRRYDATTPPARNIHTTPFLGRWKGLGARL